MEDQAIVASSSGSRKRHRSTRMHTRPRSQRNKQSRTGKETEGRQRGASGESGGSDSEGMTENNGSEWVAVAKRAAGDCPPFNDYLSWVADPLNKRFYTFGGIRPGDEKLAFTSDLYCCDTSSPTLKWNNLTDKLHFRMPYKDPFDRIELERKNKRLPALRAPGVSFLRIHNCGFLFLYGGYDEKDEVFSTLIAIDVDHHEWWYVNIKGGHVGGDVASRINPATVAIDNRIYIFGGYDHPEKRQSLNTYSIIQLKNNPCSWEWEVIDVPYSALVPPGHRFGVAVSVFNGAKILLTPGKAPSDCTPIHFSEENMFYFHTARRKFQPAEVGGNFPRNVYWYKVRELQPLALPATNSSANSSPSTSLPRQGGGPPIPGAKACRRGAEAASSIPSNHPSSSTSPPVSAPLSSPCIIICAWIPGPEAGFLVPELWRFLYSPDDENITCLKISEKVWETDKELEEFIISGGRMLLLGNGDDATEEDCSDSGVALLKTLNTYLEVDPLALSASKDYS
ncbi:hypothetical protein B0H34DRAFT_861153 [Crassisporium funariophilum]|nr:hypothetical protein B0H34DRAFT_861153 [Crassisporium funariophilum]